MRYATTVYSPVVRLCKFWLVEHAAPPSGAAPRVAADQIRTALSIIVAPDSIFGVRGLGVPTRGRLAAAFGYYDNLDEAARDIAEIDATEAAGVFFTPIPCTPAVLARSPNSFVAYPDRTTSDSEIMHRRWLFVGVDPTGPAGVAATDEECAAARLPGIGSGRQVRTGAGQGREPADVWQMK